MTVSLTAQTKYRRRKWHQGQRVIDHGTVVGWFLACRDGSTAWRAHVVAFEEGPPLVVVWHETTRRTANCTSTATRLAEKFEVLTPTGDWELERDAADTAAAIRAALALPNKPPTRYELLRPARFAEAVRDAFGRPHATESRLVPT